MTGTIRVGVIGTGFGSIVHLPGFQAVEGYEVVGVCSASAARARAAADQFGIPFACTDYRDLLGLSGLDLVSISSPPFTHCEIALAAIDRGIHVLCEKPIALSLAEARTMAAAAKAAGIVNVVNHEMRWHRGRQRFRQLVQSGFLGDLYTIDLNIFSGGRASSEQPGWSWWSQREKGGGALQAIVSHWIDLFRWCFGPYVGVYGELDHFVGDRLDPASGEYRQVSSDDSSAWIARLSSGAQIVAHYSATARFGDQPPLATLPMRAFGSAGTLALDSQDRVWGARAGEAEIRLLDDGEGEVAPQGPSGAGHITSLRRGFVPFTRLLEDLRDAIRDGRSLCPDFEESKGVQELMDAIALSQQQRRWVPLPLST